MKVIHNYRYKDRQYIKLDDTYPLSAYVYGEVHSLDDVVGVDILASDLLHRNRIKYTGDPLVAVKELFTCSYWPQTGRFIPDSDGVKDNRREKGNKFIRCSRLSSRGVQGIFDTTMIEFERRVITVTSTSNNTNNTYNDIIMI